MEKRRGFTLIELSIVLVIIGLIIGGILVGNDLIKAAGIRTTISQLESYKTAASTFRIKYNCIPGDCNHATDFWPVDTCPEGPASPVLTQNTCNGNGDGKVGGGATGDHDTALLERYRFWQHLSNAVLIPGSFLGVDNFGGYYGYMYDNMPGWVPTAPMLNNNNGGLVSLMSMDAYVYTQQGQFISTVVSKLAGQNVFIIGKFYYSLGSPAFSSADAWRLDSKMDDGNGRSGSVIATTENGTGCQGSDGIYTRTEEIATPGTWQSDIGCGLYIRGGF